MCLAQALVNHDICHQTSTTEDVFFFHLPWAFEVKEVNYDPGAHFSPSQLWASPWGLALWRCVVGQRSSATSPGWRVNLEVILCLFFPKQWWKPRNPQWLGFTRGVPGTLPLPKAQCKGCISLKMLLLPIRGSAGFGNEQGVCVKVRSCQQI